MKKVLNIILILALILNISGLTSPVVALEPPTPPSAPSEPIPPAPPAPPAPPNPTEAPVQTQAPSATQNPQSSNPTPTPVPDPASQNQNSPTPTPVNNPGSETESESVNDPLNTITGPNSDNTATETNNNTQNVNNVNDAQVTNQINLDVITGSNTASYNTLGGSITTGSAFANLNVLNNLNSNFTGIGGIQTFNIFDNYQGDLLFDIASGNVTTSFLNGIVDQYISANTKVVENSLTGPNSTNNANSTNSNSATYANNNNAILTNNINLTANTGGNSSSYNTGNGGVVTGNAVANANVVNLANTNLNVSGWLIGVVNIFGNYVGNIILPRTDSKDNTPSNSSNNTNLSNSQTGPNSSNNSNLTNTNSENFNNYNNAEVINNVDTTALTGANQASFNTGNSAVQNGSAAVNVSENTVANQNVNAEGDTVWIVIVNKLGQWFGYILGAPQGTNMASGGISLSGGNPGPTENNVSNFATGPNSTNNSSSNSSNETSLSNSNNAKIVNNINVTSNTGANSSSYNTGGGSIISGNASIGVNITNFINTNVVAKKFAVLLVNVFGSWLGNVVPPDQEIPKTAESNDNQENVNNESQITIVTQGSSQEITVVSNELSTQTQNIQNEEQKTVVIGSTGSEESYSRELVRGLYVSANFFKNVQEKNIGFSLPHPFAGENVVDIRWLVISLSLWGIITLLRKYPSQIAYQIKYLYQYFLEVML